MNISRLIQYAKRIFYIYGISLPGRYQDQKLRNLQKLFEVANGFLQQIQVEYWLDYGTLLGYHREQGIIPHDIDVDLGVSEKYYHTIWEQRHLLPRGFKMYDTSYKHRGPKLFISYRGLDADLYMYEDLGDSIRCYENAHFQNEIQKCPKKLFFPLKESIFLDQKTLVPVDPEGYLKFLYGYIGSDAKRDLTTGFWHKNESAKQPTT
ncbi:MAG: LicD family protein [Cyclobacteriaceae bacterium]|nr:LicD family protein [Cyclobacteriaceae bacterium HetDA_MAG_MS6]